MYLGVLLLFFTFVNFSLTSGIVEQEQNKMDKNLKILRYDFNKLVDNVEDFASNFLKEIEDIGKIIPHDAIFNQDYNWEKDDNNVIQKDSEESPSLYSTPTSSTTDSNVAVEQPERKNKHQQTIKDYVTEKQMLKKRVVARTKRSQVWEPSSSSNDVFGTNAQFEDSKQAIKLSNFQSELQGQEDVLGSSQNNLSQEVKDSKITTESCRTKTEDNIILEQQKLRELKNEVEQLNKLVALLKNQQHLIKDVDEKDIDDSKNVDKSFLYETLKNFPQRKENNDIKMEEVNHSSSKQVKPSKESTYLKEVSELRLNLHKNEEMLNKTKDILLSEKRKGEDLEIELKRQNSELKFLKAMMENLYDKSITEPRNVKNTVSRKNSLRNSDLNDLEDDGILGSIHTPRPLPAIKMLRSKRQDSENAIKEKLDKIFAQVHKEYINKNNLFNQKYEQDFFNNLTKNALIQLTKSDPHGLREFKEDSRKSESPDDHDSNMRRLLSVLKSKKDLQDENSIPAKAPNNFEHRQIFKDNSTSETRARSSNKNEDLQLKLNLLDMLSNKNAKNDESATSKTENFSEAIKSLLEPEKKSDDSVLLETLIKLVQEKREPPKANNQEKLVKLLQSLNMPKPQTKADDHDIENELRQLQLAINNLRPKDNSNTLNSIGSEINRRGKDDPQDFQAMLSQIISQNNVGTGSISSPPSVNLASNIGSPAGPSPQLLSQFISSHNPHITSSPQNGYSQLQNFLKLYESPSQYSKPTPAEYSSGINNQGVASYGLNSPYDSYDKLNTYGSNLNTYGSSPIDPYTKSIYSPTLNTYESAPNTMFYNSENIGFGNLNPSSPQIIPKFQPSAFNRFIGGPYSASYSPKNGPYASTISYNVENQSPSYYPYQQHSIIQPQNTFGVAQNSYAEKYIDNSGLGPVEYPPPAASAATTAPYYGVSNSNYGGKIIQGSSGSKNKDMFQYSTGFGRDYKDAGEPTRSYSGSSLDQPYNAPKEATQYKNSMIYDLNQQIQSLEGVITGLTKTGGYYQSPEDKITVAGLDEKILNLKSIIESLNQPTYSLPATNVPQPQPSYGQQTTYAAKFIPQSNFKAPVNGYSPNEPPYQSNKLDNQNHAYSEHGATFYASTQTPLPFASTPTQLPYQPSSPSQPPNSSNYNLLSPSQSNQPSLPLYQSKPQDNLQQNSDTYQPSSQAGDAKTSYQPKQSRANDRFSNIRRQKLDMAKSQIRREKRQVQDVDLGNNFYFDGDQIQPNDKGQGYEFGNDALLQIANTFKKYLEENISEPKLSVQDLPETNQQMRTNGLNELQTKLEKLKLQLESQKPLPRFLPELPTSYPAYGSTRPVDNSKLILKTTNLKTKKQDIFTHIVVQIVEKLLNALPEVLNKIFGNIFASVGGVGGDYSPLQSILKNLGAVGYLPLIAVKILDSLGSVFSHLSKNQFFKQFLLPGISLLIVGGVILFLIFFYQQNSSPYGYLDYQSSSSNYPRYEPISYNSPYSVSPYPSTRETQNIVDFRPSFSNIDKFTNNIPPHFLNFPPISYTRGYSNYYDAGNNHVS